MIYHMMDIDMTANRQTDIDGWWKVGDVSRLYELI